MKKDVLENNIYSAVCKTNSESRRSEWLSVIQRKAGDKDFIIGLINLHMLINDRLDDLRIIS